MKGNLKKEDRKILDLGWGLSSSEGEQSLDSYSLPESLSLFNYDDIFYDPTSAKSLWEDYVNLRPDGSYVLEVGSAGGLGRALLNLYETRRREARKFFEKGGRLFLKFRRPGKGLKIESGDEQNRLNAYSWIPIQEGTSLLDILDPLPTKGDDIQVVGDRNRVGDYLKEYNECFLFEQACSREVMEKNLSSNFEIIGKSGSDEIVSFSIKNYSGEIIALPPFDGEEGSEESRYLLEVTDNSFPKKPEWAENYVRDRYKRIKSRLVELEKKKRDLENRIEDKRGELIDEELISSCLYSGDRRFLVRSVEEVLKALGLSMKKSESDYLDFALSLKNQNFAVVVEGNEGGPIDLKPYKRLLLGMDDIQAARDEDYRGVLIINGYSKEEPSERSSQFTEELRERCKRKEIRTLTSVELVELLNRKNSLSEKDFNEKIRKMFSGES